MYEFLGIYGAFVYMRDREKKILCLYLAQGQIGE